MSIMIDTWVGKEFFLERYEQGRLMLSHLTNYLQERCRAEEEYQKRLEKLDKFNKNRLITEHWTLGGGWDNFESWAETEQKLRFTFWNGLNDLLSAALELRRDLQNTKQNLANEMAYWDRGREKSHSDLLKCIQKSRSVTNELEQAKQALSKQSETDKKKDVNKLQSKLTTLEKEQTQAIKQSKIADEEYKHFQKRYKSGMKKILHSFSELDARRIIQTRDLLTNFTQLNSNLYTSINEETDSLMSRVSAINERIDVNSWIKERLPSDVILTEMDSAVESFGFDGNSLNIPSPLIVEAHTKIGTKRKKKLAIIGRNTNRFSPSSDPFITAIQSIINSGTDSSIENQEETAEENVEERTERLLSKPDNKRKPSILSLFDQVTTPRRKTLEEYTEKRDIHEKKRFLSNEALLESVPESHSILKDLDRHKKVAIALYDYSAKDETELSFLRGDIIADVVDLDEKRTEESVSSESKREKGGAKTTMVNLWFEGVLNGKKGLFPFNYVEMTFPPYTKAVAEYDFFPEGDDEIPLRIGEDLLLISMSGDGWCRGKSEYGDVGLFPRNYIKILDTPFLNCEE